MMVTYVMGKKATKTLRVFFACVQVINKSEDTYCVR